MMNDLKWSEYDFTKIRQQGEISPVYDSSIYEFINHKTSDVFSGTQYQFRTEFNFDSGNINRLVKKKIQSYKGWTLVGNTIPKKGPRPSGTIYTIVSSSNEVFTGTRKEIMKKLKTKDVSRFLTKKVKKCKGWKLRDD